jgi:hypothetical protein
LNRRYADLLDWRPWFGRIAVLLGLGAAPFDEWDFAEAVARWQAGQGLWPVGVIDPRTWRRMRSALDGWDEDANELSCPSEAVPDPMKIGYPPT